MPEINCNICTRRKHCFVKEFTVLSCEDYREDSAEYKEGSDKGGESPDKSIQP